MGQPDRGAFAPAAGYATGAVTMSVAADAVWSPRPPRRIPHLRCVKPPRPSGSPIRALVGSDEPLYRAGITCVLERAGVAVVAAAGSADDLSRKARAYHPDVAVVDIDMPLAGGGGDCVEAARRIRALDPRTAVMALSRRADERYALAVLGEQAEGFGYLLKARIRDVGDFTASVRRVADGGSAIDPVVVSRLAARHEDSDPIGDLTARERQVLALMAEGRSNSSIASELVVTIAAVERHITSIFAKLGLPPDADDHRRVLAVLRYLGR